MITKTITITNKDMKVIRRHLTSAVIASAVELDMELGPLEMLIVSKSVIDFMIENVSEIDGAEIVEITSIDLPEDGDPIH